MLNWYKTVDSNNPLVVSSRIRLARNIKGIPFPKRMDDSQKTEMLKSFKTLLDGVSIEGVGTLKYINMDTVPQEETFAMVERHIISPDFAKKAGPKGIVISENESVSIMLLEEDHIRLQVLKGGLKLCEAYEIAKKIEDVLSAGLTIAFDSQLGYLTECPTNLGTGLRASVMLHLPILEGSGNLGAIAESVSKIGLTVRGMYGEGSRSHAALYQLSNQVTLGISEKAAIENLKNITEQLIAQENQARERLCSSIDIQDAISRSLGILRSALVISHDEALKLLSNVRLGIVSKQITDVSTETIDKLMLAVEPATLTVSLNKNLSAHDRDIERAKLIRAEL